MKTIGIFALLVAGVGYAITAAGQIRIQSTSASSVTPDTSASSATQQLINLSEVNPPDSGTGWTFQDQVYTINDGANVTVTGDNDSIRKITVAPDANCTVTLYKAYIRQQSLDLGNNAHLALILLDSNLIQAPQTGFGTAAIHVLSGRTLDISGTGSLTAYAGRRSAAIGGGFFELNFGNITINSGNVTAYGGSMAAGIGPGVQGLGCNGTITINGGNVNAKGAGLGAVGYAVSAGHVIINGGNVTADKIGNTAEGGTTTINGGSIKTNTMAANVLNTKGQPLYLDSLITGLPPLTNTPILSSHIDGYPHDHPNGYGIKDVKTDQQGLLYFWLPASDSLPKLIKLGTPNGKIYAKSFVRNDTTNKHTLTEFFPELKLHNQTTLDFGTVDPGYTTLNKTITVQNVGTAPSGTLNVNIIADTDNAFNVDTHTLNTINAGQTQNINVKANTKLNSHIYTAQLVVKNDNVSQILNLRLNVRTPQQPLNIKQGKTINKTYGKDQPFTLETQGGSGTGIISWKATNTNVATVEQYTGLVTIHNAGNTNIIAHKAGDTIFCPDSTMIQLIVNKGTQPALSINNVTNKTYGDPPFILNTTGGLPTINTQWTSDNEYVATVNEYGIVSINAAGIVNLIAIKPANNNYQEAADTLELIINKATQQPLIINNVTDKTYGDQPFMLTTSGGSGTGIVEWTCSNDSVANIEPNSGLATIVGAGSVDFMVHKAEDNNYHAIDTTLTINIDKATLTVTALDAEVTYLDPIPALNVIYEGFVADDDSTTLITLPVANTTAVAGDPADSYNINIAGATAENYHITYNNGILKINKRTPEASNLYITPKNTVYTGKTQTVKVDTVGVKGFGSISGVKYAGAATAPTTPGKYAITVDVNEGKNYNTISNLLVDTLVISKAPIDSVKFTINNDNTPDKALGIPNHIEGLGTIIVKFNGVTTTPITPGEYKVTVDHINGEYYQDATDFQVGIYTIATDDNPPLDKQIVEMTQGKVWTVHNNLIIETARDGQAKVYTLMGQIYITTNVNAGEHKEITVHKGFYIVVLDGKTHKVMVR